MCQLASISSRMRRFVALSSTTRTRRPSSAFGSVDGRAPPAACGVSKTAVKWNVLPLAFGALDPQASAHQLDEPQRDGQAEARAAVPPRRRAVGLRERLEDLPLLVRERCRCRCRSRRSAASRDRRSTASTLTRTTTSPSVGELDGVADDVQQHLAEPAGIAEHHLRHVGPDVAGELDALFRGAQRQQLGRVADGLAQVELGALRDRAAALRSSRSRGCR